MPEDAEQVERTGDSSVSHEACPACGTGSPFTDRFRPHGFARCPTCELVFRPDRDPEELSGLYTDAYFDNYPRAPNYLGDIQQRAYDAQQRVKWLQGHARSGRLLEVGCADGTFLAVSRSCGFQVEGIEPSPGAAARAARLHGVPVRTGTLESLELEGGHAAICAFHVLEHLAEPREALGRLLAALAPGGVVMVEVPNAESARARRLGARWPALDPVHHVIQFGPASLRFLIERVGGEVAELETVAWSAYQRPRDRWRVRRAAQYGRQLLVERAWPFSAHPDRHELLRAVVRRPAGSGACRAG